MASRKGINLPRLQKILERQNISRWGKDYTPSILATPQEAPSISHASTLNSAKLGREIHVLSTPERHAALLALYHPKLLDLHEQKMLSVGARPHPLFGYLDTIGTDLPPIQGLIDVAERLGYMSFLPRLKVDNPQDFSNPRVVVFPYIGDFLLFLRGSDGGIYCVNWTVKDTESSFKRPGPSSSKMLPKNKESQTSIARHEIEETYYCDADIRTVRISGDKIHPHVAANLTQLFGYHRTELTLNLSEQDEMLNKFRIALDAGISAMDVILMLTANGRFTSHECRTVFYQSIWERKLRVDLFRPILIDRQIAPENQDVLVEYADWFKV